MLLLLLEDCIHDNPMHKIILLCLLSWNTVHSPQHSEILHPYKIYSIYLVVIASQFVLHIVVIENSDMLDHHSPKELLYWSHWAQLTVPSPHQIAPICRERFRILHTLLPLLRKDWADLQKHICEKVSIVSWTVAKWIDSLPCPLLSS